MEVGAHLAALRQDGARLLAAARAAGLDAPVPSCAPWTVRQLLTHQGLVHRWATEHITKPSLEELPDPGELDAAPLAMDARALLEWFVEGHAALVEALETAPPELQCWTFLPSPSPRAFWARRQAHETAVHRVDAELALGGVVTPCEPEFAADGIDELLLGFFARRRPDPQAGDPPPLLVGFEPSDRPERWLAELHERKRFAARRSDEGLPRCDLVVRGDCSSLYLVLWNRRPHAGLYVEGDASLLARWREQYRVR